MANLLTLLRLLLIPVFAATALSGERVVAAVVLGVAGATDWLDGWVARRFGQVTEFGKVADPAVDRLLMMTALVIVYLKSEGSVPLWAVAMLIGRDVATLVGGAYLTAKGRRPAVTLIGKVATALLMAALALLTSGITVGELSSAVLGSWLFYLGFVLAVASGLDYLRSGRQVSQAGGTS